MSAAKHTGGKWTRDGGWIMFGERILAKVMFNVGVQSQEEVIANAKLLHAAPMMLEAMNEVIEMNRQHAYEKYGDPDRAESWGCVTVLRAAIAKATGEEIA